MYKKIYLTQKIDLLLISIEALDTYALASRYIHTSQQKLHNSIFCIKFSNYMRETHNTYIMKFNTYIHFIYDFYLFITQPTIKVSRRMEY